MRFKLYALAAILSASVATAHAWAIHSSLYWSIFWIDFPIHVAAGAMVGIIAYLVCSRINPSAAVVPAVLGLITVGVAWEAFEYLVGTSTYEIGFVADTLQDLLADGLGGGLSIWYSHRVSRQAERRV